MTKPNVLLLSDTEDLEFLDTKLGYTKHWNIFWVSIDYRCLRKYREVLQRIAARNNIDFIVYSRNDQVANHKNIGMITRYLRLGYTSISGIDQKDRIFQMKQCFRDFMECNVRMTFDADSRDVTTQENNQPIGTFSLIFDTEQVGCARYALPRLLSLLRFYNVRATFFVCEILRKIYPSIVEELTQEGHEVGIHGKWHEYLSNCDLSAQEATIRTIIQDFGCQVSGANFIGRMNKDTILAMMDNNIEYFVAPPAGAFGSLGSARISNFPLAISECEKSILMVPLSFETYNLTWFSIKNRIDTAFRQKAASNKHVTILLHPFRDGNLQHLHETEILLNYLTKKNLRGLTLKEFLDTYSAEKNRENQISIRSLNVSKRKEYSFPETFRETASIIPEKSLALINTIRELLE